ncbi:hypothetical protein [Burkholderia cepacia]|uniref:hypothetical protein n=1 Tax=Burkholderia cepacia TaxID=292 RepID=UPI00158C235B|nr:hypothetical protein [Burkholderia cepacia]
MDNVFSKKWNSMNSALHVRNGTYEIISHIKRIFQWQEKNEFSYYISGNKYKFNHGQEDEKHAFYDSTELVRYLIVKSISLHDIDALDILVSEKNDEKVRFYALLQLLNLFHGAYVLDHIATNSDFWHRIDGGQIDDQTFLSFHVLNYTFHMGKRLPNETNNSSNISNILSLSFSSDFYDENKVMEARAFMSLFIGKLISIVNSNVFDNQFVEFYKEFDPISKNKEINKTGWDILEYLNESLVKGWAGERSIAVSRIKELIDEE